MIAIDHFWVASSLCFKAGLSAKLLIWKWFYILMQIKLILTRKVFHLVVKASVFGTRKWPIDWGHNSSRCIPIMHFVLTQFVTADTFSPPFFTLCKIRKKTNDCVYLSGFSVKILSVLYFTLVLPRANNPQWANTINLRHYAFTDQSSVS